MTSDGRGGRGGSAKSDFVSKGTLIKHLMRGEGGSKKGKNHLTSYMDSPQYLFTHQGRGTVRVVQGYIQTH